MMPASSGPCPTHRSSHQQLLVPVACKTGEFEASLRWRLECSPAKPGLLIPSHDPNHDFQRHHNMKPVKYLS